MNEFSGGRSGSQLRCWPFVACAVAVALSISCSGPRRDDPDTARIKATTVPTYDTAGKLTRLTSDLTKDGKIDTWTYMDGSKILRSERDRNEDGRIDFWEYNLPDGKGGIEHTETDSNGDGIPDKWEYFEGPSIRQIEWDDNFDGVRDRRWTFAPHGVLQLVETEPDGRGGYLQKSRPFR